MAAIITAIKIRFFLMTTQVTNDKIGYIWSRVQRSQAIQFTLPHLSKAA
jgi:hypothetical protein